MKAPGVNLGRRNTTMVSVSVESRPSLSYTSQVRKITLAVSLSSLQGMGMIQSGWTRGVSWAERVAKPPLHGTETVGMYSSGAGIFPAYTYNRPVSMAGL